MANPKSNKKPSPKPTSRTKRFLFFTGGTDSVFILDAMIKLLKKNRHDELVVLIVRQDNLGSGQEKDVERAIGVLISTLAEMNDHKNKGLMSRISVTILGVGFHVENKISVGVFDTDEMKSKTIELQVTQPESVWRKYMGGVVAQELALLGCVPSLLGHLGACKNTFYLGMCGSDFAAKSTAELKQVFDLMCKVAFSSSDRGGLAGELESIGFDSLSKSGHEKVQKAWIPTIEFPLANIKKQDVIAGLVENGRCNYAVDKAEDVLQYMATTPESIELAILGKAYHALRLMNNIPKDFTTFVEFVVTKKLSFTISGKPQNVEDTVISSVIQECSDEVMARGLGIRQTTTAIGQVPSRLKEGMERSGHDLTHFLPSLNE